MRALLDGDIYAFRPASTTDELGIGIWRMEEMIDNTLAETGADEFSIFLSGDNNFRYDIYPEYKANRTAPKPVLLRALKDYLIEKYDAQVSDGCEADDLLGIEQCKLFYEDEDDAASGKWQKNLYSTIICSIDKDLRMIPGNHYSFEISGVSSKGDRWIRPAEKVYVEPFEGLKRFYTQILTGDSTDNVKGAAGIGKVKAERILRDCTTEQEMLEAVRDHFSSDEELEMTGACLWIFRKPNDRWRIPTFETGISKSQGA
jgi:5'-3' exonuclease